ncbi:MAG: ABC transporter ATP-binding protein, partial [archaeon]|nr:ABC transporter ATP-binding protein [archaeon]
MKLLEVNGLSFGYSKDSPIFSDVSFTLEDSEFVCVLGPNGVGKSTLIKCLNGILKPSKGSIRILDRDLSEYDLKEMAKTVGYVPVMSNDFNIMTVLDTVLIGRYAHQKWRTGSTDLKIAHKALEAMEIDDLAMHNFNELSA